MKIEIKQGLSEEQIKGIFDNALKRWEVVAFDNDGNYKYTDDYCGYIDPIVVDAHNGEPYFEIVYKHVIKYLADIAGIFEKYGYIVRENAPPKVLPYVCRYGSSIIQPLIKIAELIGVSGKADDNLKIRIICAREEKEVTEYERRKQ